MNNETEKPFDTVSIVLLVMIAGISDVSDAVTALIVAVPIVGQVAYFGNAFLISPIVWATIQLWFIMKVGFSGRVGLMNVAGGIGNVIGIPGSQTVTVAIAIFMANHPRLAAVGEQAIIGAATGGVGAIAAKGAAAGATAAKTAGAAAETTRGARAAKVGAKAAGVEKRAERVTAGIQAEGTAGEQISAKIPEKEIPKEALGEQPTPLEKIRKLAEEKALEEINAPGAAEEGEEREEEEAA